MQKQDLIISKLDSIEDLLKSKSEQILTFPQALDYLGASKSFLYKLTSKRKIKHFKPNGKKIYFRKSDLDDWLLQNPCKSQMDLEEESLNYISQN